MMAGGKLHLVSLGPGALELIPPAAERALRASEVIVGYELYLKQIAPWIEGREIHSMPLTQERERATKAIALARAGRSVSLVSSGDIGVYAMAALVFELIEENEPLDVCVVPGITAANSCAALLGSPLSHDFATLSLSDLLCPWEWIEERARRLAQADFVTALYNVQSRGRQQGIYRVLSVMLAHKPGDTWCGVVRNAFREEQAVEICRLSELLDRRFDMLTTIIVGNRFTQRKGRFLFTPRGYGGWEISGPAAHPAVSENRDSRSAPCVLRADAETASVWVFSGTSDGNALAREISDRGHPVIISAASEYGAELARVNCGGLAVRAGCVGIEARRRELRENNARAIVDATHPFATGISKQLVTLADELGIPYFRYERPHSKGDLRNAIRCESFVHAASEAIERGTRIFIGTGSKDLSAFLGAENASARQWFARVTPEPKHIQRAIAAGISRERLCAMQGPFSQELNEALWRGWRIDCVVTKESGDAGGFDAKAAAAQALEIPLIVVDRPRVNYPNMFFDFPTLIDALKDRISRQPEPALGTTGH